MLQLNIAAMLRSKGIDKPYAWLRKLKVSHGVAQKLANGKQVMIDRKLIGRICEAAWCTPSDLFVYVAAQGTTLPAQHPLNAIAPTEPLAFAERIKQLSPAQLKELDAVVKEMNNTREESIRQFDNLGN